MPRPISTVHIRPDFEKAYLRLPKHIQNLTTRKDQWFRKDAVDPRLRCGILISGGQPMKDTSDALERKYRDMLLKRSGEERLKMGCSMHATAQALVRASAQVADPSVSPRENVLFPDV